MENPIKMDDFWGTMIFRNTHKDPLEGMPPQRWIPTNQ